MDKETKDVIEKIAVGDIEKNENLIAGFINSGGDPLELLDGLVQKLGKVVKKAKDERAGCCNSCPGRKQGNKE